MARNSVCRSDAWDGLPVVAVDQKNRHGPLDVHLLVAAVRVCATTALAVGLGFAVHVVGDFADFGTGGPPG